MVRRLTPEENDHLFRMRVTELGGTVIEPAWLGLHKPYRVQCQAGHLCMPLPANIRRGQGICRTCAGQSPLENERSFRTRVAELGGEVLEPLWLGSREPHRVRCPLGHECRPRPKSLQEGNGLCQICAGNDSVEADKNFRARVEALGGKVIEPAWLGANIPHQVLCPVGHMCAPRPKHIQQGSGLCRRCSGSVWDALYVVVNEPGSRLKFGITSGDPRPRLRVHHRAGYTKVERLRTALATAHELEQAIRHTLVLAGEKPTQGREYFSLHVLGTVLDIVDSW